MATDFELNGVDASTYGFTAMTAPGLLGTAENSYDKLVEPSRTGARVGLEQSGVKAFQVAGMLTSTSLATARSNLDSLVAQALIGQASTVVMGWSTTRRLVAKCLGVQAEPLGSLFGVWKYDTRFLFEAPDPPFWQGTSQHSVGSIQSTGVSLPAGNAPARLQVLVAGPTSNIELKLQNSTGTQVASVKFTGVNLSGSTHYACIDMDARTAYQNVTGTFSSGTSLIDNMTSSGDFFQLLPDYADYNASSWAVLQCVTGGTSGGTATAYYYKAWR